MERMSEAPLSSDDQLVEMASLPSFFINIGQDLRNEQQKAGKGLPGVLHQYRNRISSLLVGFHFLFVCSFLHENSAIFTGEGEAEMFSSSLIAHYKDLKKSHGAGVSSMFLGGMGRGLNKSASNLSPGGSASELLNARSFTTDDTSTFPVLFLDTAK